MKKYRRTSFLILMFLFVFFFFFNPFPTSFQTISKKKPVTLLLLPLDSRPVNTYVPSELVQQTNATILTPPLSLLGNLHTPGNQKKLQAWVLQNVHQADGFIISTDMLTYGGLVASRTSTLSEKEALEQLSFLKTLHTQYPNKPLYAYTSILRLAPTASSNSDLPAYQHIRRWAELSYEINILHDVSHQKEWQKLHQTIPTSLLKEYQQTRTRNLHINEALLSYVEKGIIDYLIIGKDDASKKGIHQAEQQQLQEKVASMNKASSVLFFSGIDEAGSVLVSRFLTTHNDIHPFVYVWYNSPFAPFWHAPFEDDSLSQNIQRHLEASGARITHNPWKANIYLLAQAPLPSFLQPLSSYWLNYHLRTGKQVMVADVSMVNQANHAFTSSLLTGSHVPYLLAYSGWGTAGNSLGLSVSHGLTRYLYLTTSNELSSFSQQVATQHHLSLLYRSFLLDDGYHSKLAPALKKEVIANKGDPLFLAQQEKEITKKANQSMKQQSSVLFQQSFQHKNVPLTFQKVSRIQNVKLPSVSFPWHRLFELDVKPHITIEKKD